MPQQTLEEHDAVWRDWLPAINKPGVGVVVVLTMIGGVLRFIRLDHPPLLFDEAATYTRVTGSFEQLLNILRYDGFAPLHYLLYWLMSRFVRLTPEVMRVVPALAGTLMIPAMYFLARQVVSRRVATVAAAFTAFSAWQLVYSRDAKMYMELWLAATVFVACLLWWLRQPSVTPLQVLRTNPSLAPLPVLRERLGEGSEQNAAQRLADPVAPEPSPQPSPGVPGEGANTNGPMQRIAWLSWVAAGALMNGLHALGLLVIAAAVVIVLTHPLLTRRKLILATLGLIISCAGIAGHYAFFNRFGQRIQSQGWRSGGLEWNEQRNQRFSKPFLLWDTAASWMLAYRSPRPPIDPPKRVVRPVVVISSITMALLIAGMLPWPRRLRDDDPEDAPPHAPRALLHMLVWLALPLLAFAAVPLISGRDVWNARYLGIVWPPLAVLSAWLILRLPHPQLRGAAIALLIGANLIQYGLRVSFESGIPVDQIARDVATANQSGGQIATVVAVDNKPASTSLGGNGGIFDFPGRYYLAITNRLRLRPRQLRSEPFEKNFNLTTEVRNIAPTARRLILWTDVDAREPQILESLAPGWRRLSSAEHRVRDFWCWRSMFRCRRSVYQRDRD